MGKTEVPILYRSVGLSVAAEREAFRPSMVDVVGPHLDDAVFVDRNALAVDRIVGYMSRRLVTVVEPYPLQLWGGVEDERQSAGFQAGFRFIQKLTAADRAGKIKYFALEDDITNAPARISQDDLDQRRGMLYGSSSSIQESPFANPKLVGPNRYRRFTQSALARSAGSQVCSRVDAEFNYNKILEQIASSGRGGTLRDANSLHSLLLVVVHPDTPWMMEQQLIMVQALFEKMRSKPILKGLTRDKTFDTITQMFRHVWINPEGNVTAVSRPARRFDSWIHERELL